jgi:hypothetical protein
MADTNIILGYGETLTEGKDIPRGGTDKSYPYTIEEQRAWLIPQFDAIIAGQRLQNTIVKPRGESVIQITLHPTFLAKSFHPNSVLVASGLRCVGSKSLLVTPRKVTTKKTPRPTYTAQLFVAGNDSAFIKLTNLLRQSSVKTYTEALRRFELVSNFSAKDKLYIQGQPKEIVTVEVVLHASKEDGDILKAFEVRDVTRRRCTNKACNIRFRSDLSSRCHCQRTH